VVLRDTRLSGPADPFPADRARSGPLRDLTDPDQPAAPRVLSLDHLAAYVLEARPRLGPVRLVCVDGPACSGKTTLAARLATALEGCPIVHMDDLYEGWDGLPTVGDRLEEWILAPIRAGRPGRYRRYDWTRGAYAEWHEVPLHRALVIEGVGSAARLVDGHATLRIWMEAPEQVRLERARVRDAGGFDPYWRSWADAERRHFTLERTRDRADVVLDGAPEVPYDVERAVVATSVRLPGLLAA